MLGPRVPRGSELTKLPQPVPTADNHCAEKERKRGREREGERERETERERQREKEKRERETIERNRE